MASSRKLQYADRVALQQADQAIRKDVLRALVEIITNSNDSYARIEDAGQKGKGEIIIEVLRKHKNSIFRVRDFAEGMNDSRMDKVVGTYGEATSGLKQNKHVRGMWGRGLKDSIFGLGHGYVRSFRGGNFFSCSLLLKAGIPTFTLADPIPATPKLRAKYGIPARSGTVVEIIVSRSDVKIPQFDNLRNYLQRHFELRPIMSNPRRRIVLREMTAEGKIRQDHVLSYKAPKGTQVLSEKFKVPGFNVKAKLQVFHSEVQLSTRGEEGDYADGGLLVISKGMVISLTMLKFENDPYGGYFYGSIHCDHMHELLKQDEPVLTATRDGINWSLPFTRALKLAVEKKLEPLVEKERKLAQHQERSKLDKQFKQKIEKAIHEVNTIALSELAKKDKHGNLIIDLPPSGMVFMPQQAYVQTGKHIYLTLRVKFNNKARAGTKVPISSNSAEVIVSAPQVKLKRHKKDPTVGEALVRVDGRQVGGTGVVTAKLGGQKAQAQIEVLSRKNASLNQRSKGTNSLFSDIRFDERTDPRQRVYYDRAKSSIVIATKASSIKLYLDQQGRLDSTVEGQVLLAELITEAVCREIARNGVERGVFLAPDGSVADAVQNHFIRLQYKYAHLIHKNIVTRE